MQSSGSAVGNSLGDNSFNRDPHFDTSASKNVTALLGKTAYLNCRVKNLANKTVSVCIQIILLCVHLDESIINFKFWLIRQNEIPVYYGIT